MENSEILVENDIENDIESIDNLEIYDSVYYNVKPSNNYKVYLKYYWKLLVIIGCFYILPSLQFLLFQINDNSIHCYYNNKCKKQFYFIPAFNNVISNLGYVIFGIIYILYVKNTKRDKNSKYGIHSDVSLYYSLGISLIWEGLFSSIYHLYLSKQDS